MQQIRKPIKYLLVIILMCSCGSTQPILASSETKQVFTEKTSATAKEGYSSALSYLARNLGDSNYAIRMKDFESKKIVTKIGLSCNELNDSMFKYTYTAHFTVEASFKDNSVKITVYAENYTKYWMGNPDETNTPFVVSQKNGLDKCMNRIKNQIMGAII